MRTNEVKNEIKKKEKNVTDIVLEKVHGFVESGDLVIPPDYSAENALKAAWIELQNVKDKNDNRALDCCTTSSIANALLDMVVQGLSPAKKQCYFIAYGKELTLLRSYFGSVAVAKRFSGVKTVTANCIYEEDVFKYDINPDTGYKILKSHSQSFKNIDNKKIVGAYAIVTRDGDKPHMELMTMDEIRTAWGQGATKGKSPAHTNFTGEMAKKTVINRACKHFINTSNDSGVLADSYNRTLENEYKEKSIPANYTVVDEDTKEKAREAERIIANGGDDQELVANNSESASASELFTDEEKAEIEENEALEAKLEEEGIEYHE